MENIVTLMARLQRYFEAVAAIAPGQPVPTVAPALSGDVPAGAPPSARRTPLLACTLETLRPAARVVGVEILILSDQSPLNDVLANLDTIPQELGKSSTQGRANLLQKPIFAG